MITKYRRATSKQLVTELDIEALNKLITWGLIGTIKKSYVYIYVSPEKM